ncbi:hypothetical protein F5Y13DRAFT_197352 [Hypoxylon sp. FL1857]|nr:hypothetical protein F5Y13DRAFT_197352 [Hypoxylon sp. FL1857]
MSSISCLPESTTRLLGSPLVVTTPVTLVKELLDNSIDAKATSIEVIISADTIKKIEVRDNGSGIHPDDYDALGRRGHTSKLRNFDELKNCSIKTLGFRGEALASANSLAQVTVTTKIASEPVAAILHIHPNTGGVLKQQPTSAPVGTTVSVTDLFGRLPVREQVTIKESAKTIDKIRELLRSYAMARPRLRLSFRVLQSPKQNWSYSPKTGAGVKEAAIQLFGAELATHCLERTFEIGGTFIESSSSDEHPSNDQYLFEAFMLKPASDTSKVPRQRYISVDGRPLTVKKGMTKKLLKIYAEHVAVALGQGSPADIPKDCFIRLNIKCPPGSYDVNIEPSKDEVLFSNEETVLDGFKGLCEETYKKHTLDGSGLRLPLRCRVLPDKENDMEVQEPPPIGPRTGPSSGAVISETVLQAGSPAPSQEQQSSIIQQHTSTQLQEGSHSKSSPSTISSTPINTQTSTAQTASILPSLKDTSFNTGFTRYKVDMSTDFNEYSHSHPRKGRQHLIQELTNPQEEPDLVEYPALRDVNPWAIAKMNALSLSAGSKTLNGLVNQDSPQLPTFEPPMTPDPPILHHTEAAPGDLDVLPSQRYLHSQESRRQLQPRLPGGPYRNPMLSTSGIATRKATDNAIMQASAGPRRRRNYPPWSPPSSIEGVEPSINCLAGTERGPASDGMKQTTISFGNRKRRRLQADDGAVDYQVHQDQDMGGENDVRRMLAAARQSLSHQLSRQGACQDDIHPEATRSQPYTRVQLSQDQVEASYSKIKEPIKTSLPDGDPRAYLLRRQKSVAAEEGGPRPTKLRRMKSSLLPLENVPSYDEVHSLVFVKVLSIEALRTSTNQGAPYDRYVKRGAVVNGLKMSLDDGRAVEGRLKSLLRIQKWSAGGGEVELEIGLCSLLKGKGVSTSA